MKHYKKRSLWALAMFILILYACVDEVAWRTTPENNSISVKEAQRYFNEHVQTFYLCGGKQARSADEALLVTPLWEKGKNVLFRNQQMVEVPVYAPMTITKNLNAMQEDSARHVNTLYNLLAEKMEDGNILFTIAKVTCEIDCLKKIRGKRLTFHIGYDNLKEFSGTIRYYSLEGEFLTGFDYRNGRRIAIIESSKPYDPNKESSAKRKATRGGYEYCRTDFIAEDVFYCYDVIIGGEVTKSVCEYDHTDYYEETHCEWIETGDGDSGEGGEGEGGGGVGENKEPTEPCVATALLTGDASFKSRVEEHIKNIANHLSDGIEDGWAKTSENLILSPSHSSNGKCSFAGYHQDLANRGVKIQEQFHTHPTGGPIPSASDLANLSGTYVNGLIEPDNFVYGVLSQMGCTSLVISDVKKFETFKEEVLRNYENFKNQYNNIFAGATVNLLESITTLIKFLEERDSGLSVIFVETDRSTEVIKINWEDFKPREINTNNELIIKNCNP